jgi:hypothetical protein
MILDGEDVKEIYSHKTDSKPLVKEEHKQHEVKTEPKHSIREEHKQHEAKANHKVLLKEEHLPSIKEEPKHEKKAEPIKIEPHVETKQMEPEVELKIEIKDEIHPIKEKTDNSNFVEFNEKDIVELTENPKSISHSLKMLDDNWVILSKYFQLIYRFFTSNDLLKVAQLNKLIANKAFKVLIDNLQGDLDKNTNRLKTLTDKYTTVDLTEKLPSPFVLTRGASKAVELLNDGLYAKIFKEDNLPIDDIIMIYRLFFYLTNSPQVAEIKENFEFWSACCNHFNSIPNIQIGKYILDLIPNLNFNNENLFKMHKVLGNNSHKITPTHFSKLCGTTGLFLFLLKDAFEYCGILADSKKTPPYNAYNFEKYYCEFVGSVINKFNTILNKIKG